MRKQMAKVTYNGTLTVIHDDTLSEMPYRVHHSWREYNEEYGYSRKRTNQLGKFSDLQSAVFYIYNYINWEEKNHEVH